MRSTTPTRLIYSGVDFTNDVAYTLTVTMDFGRNRWSAMLDNPRSSPTWPSRCATLPLNLGDIDALWVLDHQCTRG